ncbi:M48 family metallopeptidase [Novosphingobium lentum]|uniref:M48 family metallopeptidase n=1 Tax=Novosphingobium lentum TaxID=145287 RepID=UPI000836F678|nr:SprT family zinc-dependent metalloprotease [Novosphingobium lentum]
MIDWLRRPPFARTGRAATPAEPARPEPRRTVSVGGRDLPLVVRKLRQAQRMTLRLAPDGREVRVSIPAWGRVGEAEAFARDRSDWLARQLATVAAPSLVEPGATLPYRGEALVVNWQATARRTPVLDDGAIVVGGPLDGLSRRLQRWLEADAKRLFADDLAHYCTQAREDVPPLGLSRAQRRWGSCAADGTIRVNWRLVMAPDFVRRSVVAHEVAHLAHFDHSPAFHAHLDRVFEGDIAAANRWLKRSGRSLYQPFG